MKMSLILYLIPFVLFLTLIIWSKNQFDKAIDAFQGAAQQTEQLDSRP